MDGRGRMAAQGGLVLGALVSARGEDTCPCLSIFNALCLVVPGASALYAGLF